MPQYTTTAFRWSGTGYNAQYNTSYAVVFDDDDPNLDGAADTNETVSINGGPFGATSGPPYDINVSFTDTNGNALVETFYFFQTGGSWYFVPGPGSAFTVGATLGTYQSHTTTPTPYTTITCFARGTLIQTDTGPLPVEKLSTGCRVLNADGAYKTLRASLTRTLGPQQLRNAPKLAPVRISAGALGNGLPRRDLLVSRQHRMLVSSKVCERMFGKSNVLVAAIRLTELPGIFVDRDIEEVAYYHLLFDRHEVVYAEGAPSESFYAGPQALRAVSRCMRAEILALFPDLATSDRAPASAFLIPPGPRQKNLIARHLKNNHAICP